MQKKTKIKKQKWAKPKLIILTGGKMEERVLLGCKNSSANFFPSETHAGCKWQLPVCNFCGANSPS